MVLLTCFLLSCASSQRPNIQIDVCAVNVDGSALPVCSTGIRPCEDFPGIPHARVGQKVQFGVLDKNGKCTY